MLGSVHPAKGARGGHPGTPARQFVRSADGTLSDPLPPYGVIVLKPGETVVSMSGAGGGYRPPTERDPELVRRDAAEGWISPQRALNVYGVVLDEDGRVDAAATEEQRTRLAGGDGR